jgi:hypothetical protein
MPWQYTVSAFGSGFTGDSSVHWRRRTRHGVVMMTVSYVIDIHSSGAKVVRDKASFHDLISIHHLQGGAGENTVMVGQTTHTGVREPPAIRMS